MFLEYRCAQPNTIMVKEQKGEFTGETVHCIKWINVVMFIRVGYSTNHVAFGFSVWWIVVF